jgi:hypothetical protein
MPALNMLVQSDYAEIDMVENEIEKYMKHLSYGEDDIYRAQLAAREIVSNVMLNANKLDKNKHVAVSIQGNGFRLGIYVRSFEPYAFDCVKYAQEKRDRIMSSTGKEVYEMIKNKIASNGTEEAHPGLGNFIALYMTDGLKSRPWPASGKIGSKTFILIKKRNKQL